LEEDVFEKSSSTRLSEFLEDIRTTLAAEQYGWTLDYFPGSKYAGVTYALKFTEQQVTEFMEEQGYSSQAIFEELKASERLYQSHGLGDLLLRTDDR